ncbi:MAG TPA: SH3 domain-containing protein [Microvirga sp.]|jgi:SH3-like domain-containing protein|nr:SH3 domain-containing protein [Microvirga sp.]
MRKTVLAIVRGQGGHVAVRAGLVAGLLVGLLAGLLAGFAALPAAAQAPAPGGRLGTGLPVPRYVSLKTDRVNLREGPSKDHRTAWVFQRAGLPVEIVAEYETWRRIRDAEGTEGWVLHSLLSGRRTALVMPWAKGEVPPIPLLDEADERSAVVARLQPGVIANVKQCSGTWCRVAILMEGARDLDGFIRQDRLWGVYPNEKVE